MSSTKIGNIKVPPFERVNYNLWKKKMTMFLKALNPMFLGILEKGLGTPMKMSSETTCVDVVKTTPPPVPKDPSEYTEPEKELVGLDTYLQLMIVDLLDTDMCHQILNCVSLKHMWDTIKTIME